MKASELIEVLKKAIAIHGDLPVFSNIEYDYEPLMVEIELKELIPQETCKVFHELYENLPKRYETVNV